MIGAQEAKEIGLVNAVFPAASFREDVDKFLAEILNKSRPILIWTQACHQGEPRRQLPR